MYCVGCQLRSYCSGNHYVVFDNKYLRRHLKNNLLMDGIHSNDMVRVVRQNQNLSNNSIHDHQKSVMLQDCSTLDMQTGDDSRHSGMKTPHRKERSRVSDAMHLYPLHTHDYL